MRSLQMAARKRFSVMGTGRFKKYKARVLKKADETAFLSTLSIIYDVEIIMTTFQYEKLYNGQLKREYIDAKYSTKATKSKETIYSQLNKMSKCEFELGKNIFDMDEEELNSTLKLLRCSTITSAINHINTFKNYIQFAKNSGVNNSKSMFLEKVVVAELADEIIDPTKCKRYKRADILQAIKAFDNYTDAALLLCLFEGIKGDEFSEIFTLNVNNLMEEVVNGQEKYKVTLYNSKSKSKEKIRTIEISQELYYLLQRAHNQTEYISTTGTGRRTPYQESDYVFKKARKGKQDNSKQLSRSFITRKFIFFKDYFGNHDLDADDIVRSGMMHLAYTLLLTCEEFTKEEWQIIHKQYDTRLATSDMKNYYVDTTFLRRTIFTAKFEELYRKEIELHKLQATAPLIKEKEKGSRDFFYTAEIEKAIRNGHLRKAALELANYQCLIDCEHQEFISKATRRNYVEVHHFIPLKYQEQWNSRLDCIENLVCLCASCHRKLHYGLFEDKKALLHTIYTEKLPQLEKAHLSVSLQKLYQYYAEDFAEELRDVLAEV